MKEDIEEKAVQLYINNLKFIEKKDKKLFDKLKVFEEALSLGHIKENYILEYKETYFDIYDKKVDNWYYSENSLDYSKRICKNISYEASKNSFKSFYEFHYEEGLADRTNELSILSDAVLNNAPIVDYVNRNLPDEEEMKQIFCYFIFGVGLGFHIPELVNNIKPKMALIVEPSLEIFRLSLFLVNYERISTKTRILFFVGLSKEDFYGEFRTFQDKTFLYNQYIKFFLFSKSCEVYFDSIQNALISQAHLMYSYERELKSIVRTYNYSQKHFNFMDIHKNQKLDIFRKNKVLILAAGPSVKKNLDFIKENKDKFIIVAVYNIIPLLTDNDIIPDIITQYDEDSKDKILNSLNRVKDITLLDNSLFFFSSHVSTKLTSKIKKENIYFFNAIHSSKDSIGSLTGPSIGDMTYGLMLLLGASNVYLLGLDLALDPDTGSSHFDGYLDNKHQLKADSSKEVTNYSFHKNIIKVKGNLRNIVETIPIFHISIVQMNSFTKKYLPNDAICYNMSDGAYYEGIVPLDIEKNDFTLFESIKKDEKRLLNELKKSMDTISSSDFSDKDIEYNINKHKDSIVLEEKIKALFIGIKYSTVSEFMKGIERCLLLLSEDLSCNDLKRVLRNYYRHNLPYICHLLNIKRLNNPKKHIKTIQKRLFTQISKIIELYQSIVKGGMTK
ncbi:motility associated factor glycosyltransferase family protein [Halarcobacter ebronensis]|uniref:motility associated factor glycosyltransferase family protein n=1 Tax=Halarcobacter ebronensis TaxID=1462615 RepID=UPI003C73E6E2